MFSPIIFRPLAALSVLIRTTYYLVLSVRVMWSVVRKHIYRSLQVGFLENSGQMGRTRSQKIIGPACVRNDTRNQGSAKRSASISNVNRKVLRTMPPVKSPNGDGGEPLDAVAGKASAAAAAAGSPRHFRFTDIMEKKLNGGTWTEAEIKWFISEIVKENGAIEASQIGKKMQRFPFSFGFDPILFCLRSISESELA